MKVTVQPDEKGRKEAEQVGEKESKREGAPYIYIFHFIQSNLQ